MVMTISETLYINESIIGFTFVAAATSMEETITSISICRREVKSQLKQKNNQYKSNKLNMAVSNCIGSNVFDLSIGIGLPYLINALFMNKSINMYTGIYSNISFTVIGLLVCLSLFLLFLNLFKWRLTIPFGILIILIWSVFTLFVILIESNIIQIEFLKNFRKEC